MHVYETAADQSFFVHVPSLLEKGFADITDSPFMGDNSRSMGKVTFVYLKKDGPQLVSKPITTSGISHIYLSVYSPTI